MKLTSRLDQCQSLRNVALTSSTLIIVVALAAPSLAQTKSTRKVTGERPFAAVVNAEKARTSPKSNASRETVSSYGATQRFEKANLEVEIPPAPWSPVEVPNRNPNMCVAIHRENPDITLILLAEPLPPELKLTNADLVKGAKARLLAVAPDMVFTAEFDDTRNGIKGTTFDGSQASARGSKYWTLWVATRNGFTYQLAVYGSPAKMFEISEASRDFLSHLKQIEPSRLARSDTSEIAALYKSKELGYEIDLTGQGWIKSEQLTAKIPAADFSVVGARGTGLVVMAIPMPRRSPNMELLTTSMLAGIGLDQPGNELVRTTPYMFGALNCKEMEFTRPQLDGKKTLARVRLITNERCAYMLYGSSLADDKEGIARVRKGLDGFGVIPSGSFAVSTLPINQLVACAAVLNDLGLRHYASGDLVAGQDFFGGALELSPTNDVYAHNYAEVVAKLDRTDEALAFLNQYQEKFLESYTMRALRARLLCQKGDSAEGRKVYSELFAKGYTDEATLSAYIDAAIAAKSYDEALTAVDSVMKRKPTLVVQRWQASLYGMKGDHEKAIELFEALHSRYPADDGVALDTASTYERAHQYEKSLAITQQLIDAGRQDELVLLLHGATQLHLDRMADAKKTFEHARELYPHSDRVADMLKVASSQLGEGENSCLKNSIEPVAMPTVVRKAIEVAEKGEHADATEYGAEELVHIVGLTYEPGKPMRTTTTQRIKVYTTAGVSRYATLTFALDSLSERFFVNQLRVTDGKGQLVSEGSVENYYVTDETESGEASNRKTVKIPVPGLKPGYTVECTVTRELVAPAREFPFQEVSLAGESPIRVSAFFVAGDVAHARSIAAGGVTIQKSKGLLYCVQTDTTALRSEPNQPAVETFTPMLWLGPDNKEWAAEAQTYIKSIDDKLAVDGNTEVLAAELTSNCKSNREKLAVIAQHVQQGYTYHAIEFGRRARIPNAAAKTIALKYGDCKDHALLTRQLLAAAGIQSHLALVHVNGTVVEEIPSLDQFDHMVVFVPAAELDLPPNAMDGLVVDATSKDADPFLDPPCGLTNRAIMVLDPRAPHFVHTAKYPEDAGKIVCNRRLTFDIRPSGSVDSHVNEEVELSGYLAPPMRSFFKHFDVDGRREAMQTLLSDNGPIRVKNVETENLEAVSEPLRIRLEYLIPNSFYTTGNVTTGKSLVGSLPCVWETRFTMARALDARKTPFEVQMPRFVKSSLTISPPPGYQFVDLSQCNGSGRSQFRSWSSSASQQGTTVSVEFEVHMVAGLHPATEYENFYTDMNDSLAALRTPITLHEAVSEVAGRSTGPALQAR